MKPTDNATGDRRAGRRLLPRLGLRSRIVVAFVLFGLILSSGFAAVAYFSMDDFEGIVVRQLLASEMQQVIESRRVDPDNPLPSSRRMHARVVPLAALDTLPASLASLPPGIHVLDEDGEHEIYVDAEDVAGQRFYYFINLGDVAERERFVQWLLAAIVILGTLASGGLGLLFAGYLISPVQRLARWVDASIPDHPGGALEAQFADDEVGALAAAFDRYQDRLEAFLHREREFTADASHELRSPLSVLKAGLDVVAEDAGVGPRGRRALQRMDRRAAELGDLLDALLYLARSDSDPDGSVADIPLLPTWQRLLDGQAGTDPNGAMQARVSGDPHATTTAPPRIARLVFSRLLERALHHAGEENVHIHVAPGRVEIRPWSVSTNDVHDGGQRRSDEGFGLTLLTRLCLRLGWELEPAEGGVLLLEFSRRASAQPSG
jgi:signal transduction histidine kinase